MPIGVNPQPTNGSGRVMPSTIPYMQQTPPTPGLLSPNPQMQAAGGAVSGALTGAGLNPISNLFGGATAALGPLAFGAGPILSAFANGIFGSGPTDQQMANRVIRNNNRLVGGEQGQPMGRGGGLETQFARLMGALQPAGRQVGEQRLQNAFGIPQPLAQVAGLLSTQQPFEARGPINPFQVAANNLQHAQGLGFDQTASAIQSRQATAARQSGRGGGR